MFGVGLGKIVWGEVFLFFRMFDEDLVENVGFSSVFLGCENFGYIFILSGVFSIIYFR